MSEPVVTCPSCGTDIKLTETLAAPIVAAERSKIESELRVRAEAVEAREKTIATERTKLAQQATELERLQGSIDEKVTERIRTEREAIAKEAGKKATDAAAAELKAASEALIAKDAKLADAQKAELEVRKQREALEQEKREFDLKLTRAIDEEREKARTAIRAEEVKKANDAVAGKLKAAEEAVAEKDTKLAQAQKSELEVRKQREALEQEKREFDLRLTRAIDEEREKARTTIRTEEAKKASDAVAARLKAAEEAVAEKDAKLAEAQKAELEIRKERQALEDEKRSFELKLARAVDDERNSIREATRKEDDEQYRLKIAEKDKVIEDVKKQLEEARRKSEQGSQQLQGEIQELDLECLLRNAFPDDTIEPVTKGQHGGDALQRVLSPSGQLCGTILWESKRTKNWSDQWLPKLRDDQRAAKADLAAVMTAAPPKGLDSFDHVDGVWVTKPACVLPVAAALRQILMETAGARRAMEGRQGKMDLMYGYLTGPQFRQRVSAMAEAYINMRTDLDAERRAITKSWSKREKQLERMLNGMVGMYGDLQGIVGASLPEIEGLDLPLLEAAPADAVAETDRVLL